MEDIALSQSEQSSICVDRLGMGLYGVNPHTQTDTPAAKQLLANVATLEAEVMQVRRVRAGATVGYGSTHCVSGSRSFGNHRRGLCRWRAPPAV